MTRVVLTILFLSLLTLLVPLKPVFALEDVSYTVTVTASYGQPKLTVFGYTSPEAEVWLQGIGVAKQVWANKEGYFIFDRVFIPPPYHRFTAIDKEELAHPEIYLYSIDTEHRISQPVVLPPIPLGNYNVEIGPVLISPTITLEKGNFLPEEQVIASGQTIPNSSLKIYLASQPEQSDGISFWLKTFFRKIFYLSPLGYINPYRSSAFFIPEYQIQINESGRFQFNLPNKDTGTWKAFAGTNYLGSLSPKSNTLNFTILDQLSWFSLQMKGYLGAFWEIVGPFIIYLLIAVQILLILLLVLALRGKKPHHHKPKHKVKKEEKDPTLTESGAKIFAKA